MLPWDLMISTSVRSLSQDSIHDFYALFDNIVNIITRADSSFLTLMSSLNKANCF